MRRALFALGGAAVASVVGAFAVTSCTHASSDAADAAVFVGRPGDLGANSAIIDHSGPSGGLVGTVQHGALGDTWQPAGCPGTVPIASGVIGAAWGEDNYGVTDKSPHAVHTGFRFDSSSSFAAIWETDADTHATFLAYGDSPTKLDHIVQGVTFTNPIQAYDNLDYPLLAHEAHACNLQPSHAYYYAVGGDGWYGAVNTITTAPAVGSTDSFRFLAMGDSNALYSLFAQLQVSAATYAPAFTLFTGDMVHDGVSQMEWEWWFTAAGSMIANVPTLPVHGNHEELATAYFALWTMPGVEEIYSLDYGMVHFVVLNDSPNDDSDLTNRQAQFLDADLTAVEARPTPPTWIITSHHRPMFSSDPQEGSNTSVRAAWQPIYEKHHVDVDFNGHSHHYESTLPILGDDGGIVPDDGGGIRYITTGGAGALFDSPTPTVNPWTIVYYAGLSLATVDVTQHTLTIQGRRSDGSSIEAAPIVLTK